MKNSIEIAVSKAIEGGWKNSKDKTNSTLTDGKGDVYFSLSPFLDPSFWQSLGKAMGWKGDDIRLCVGCGRALKHNERNCKCGDGCFYYFNGQWAVEWHRFIDHLIEGKDANSFFANLLKS